MSKIVDARGLACPQPVIKTKNALETNDGVVVIVDNPVARENVSRLAKSLGCEPNVEEKPDGTYIAIFPVDKESRNASSKAGLSCPPRNADTGQKPGPLVITIQQDRMGRGDDELGYVLIKSFIHTLGEVSPAPDVIVFLNTGVKLSVKGSDVVEDLKNLQKKGVQILVCGTCLNFFGLTDELEAGIISNMYDISDTLLSAGKIVSV
jgi:selenium metabolism protein YedF